MLQIKEGEREREREKRERDTDRQKDKETERETERENMHKMKVTGKVFNRTTVSNTIRINMITNMFILFF